MVHMDLSIWDFNMSAKMAELSYFCTVLYASRRYHQRQLRYAIDDIESFFYSMLHMVGVPLKWFKAEHRDKTFEQRDQLFGELKSETQVVRVKTNFIYFFNICFLFFEIHIFCRIHQSASSIVAIILKMMVWEKFLKNLLLKYTTIQKRSQTMIIWNVLSLKK